MASMASIPINKIAAEARTWPRFTELEGKISQWMFGHWQNPQTSLIDQLRQAYWAVLAEHGGVGTPIAKEEPMPVFDVTFTVSTFKTVADGSQMKVEKMIGQKLGVVASGKEQAIALAAATGLQGVEADEVANAIITVK